jgi:hypothetical protein
MIIVKGTNNTFFHVSIQQLPSEYTEIYETIWRNLNMKSEKSLDEICNFASEILKHCEHWKQLRETIEQVRKVHAELKYDDSGMLNTITFKELADHVPLFVLDAEIMEHFNTFLAKVEAVLESRVTKARKSIEQALSSSS